MAQNAVPVFISFDYDHDEDLKTLLIGQARNRSTPFAFTDWSIKKETKGWKDDARKRIRRCDLVIAICGTHTDSAKGVATEIKIAREERIPFWLLQGRKDGGCKRPQGTWPWESIHPWKWDTIEHMCRYITLPWWKRIW